MPKIYRVMLEADGKPAVGADRNMLGARPGSPPDGDLPIDESGGVAPETGGMSVNICPFQLPYFLVPRHLAALGGPFKGAKGKPGTRIWSMGEGPFVPAKLTENLTLVPDRTALGETPDHACVAPTFPMPLDTYQAALAATQPQWHLDERKNEDCPLCRKPGLS